MSRGNQRESFFRAMFGLQFLYGQEHLSDLVCLGLALFVLDIYPGVARPRVSRTLLVVYFSPVPDTDHEDHEFLFPLLEDNPVTAYPEPVVAFHGAA